MENQEENQIITNPKDFYLSLSLVDKSIFSLKNELKKLKKGIEKIRNHKLVKGVCLPDVIYENSGIVKPVRRTKRGLGFTPLTESEIKDAQEKNKTASSAARYLKVDYYTFRKYANLFGLWKINPSYKEDGFYNESGKYPLSKLLLGEFPDYPVFRLKNRLIKSGIKKPECEQCGYKERRITDNKLPLILNFEDGNQKNHKLENMKLLCYNCTFCSGKGYIRSGKKFHNLDEDIPESF